MNWDSNILCNNRNVTKLNVSKTPVMLAMAVLAMLLLVACGEAEKCAYDDKPAADLSEYENMKEYYMDSRNDMGSSSSGSDAGNSSSGESNTSAEENGDNDDEGKNNDIKLVDTTVEEIEKMMKDGETFAFIASFAECPYCNQLMPYFNESAKRADRKAGHLDTRKDPEWKTNMDIDDYDTFVKLFGKYLDKENDGKAHLYTPMIFFIKDGEIVAYHKNVIEGADDPKVSLTKTRENKLNKMLDEKFEQMN